LAGRKDEAMWREVQVVLGYLPEEAVGCPIVAIVFAGEFTIFKETKREKVLVR
jgi:hypothetical protein